MHVAARLRPAKQSSPEPAAAALDPLRPQCAAGDAAGSDLAAGLGLEPPLGGPELAQLVAQAQGGDVAAFERLIGLYQRKIYGFARAFTSDKEQASDVTQEALIKIYRSLGGFRYQSSLLTWIFRIVKNVFLDHHKSRRAKERKLEQPLDTTGEPATVAPSDLGPEAQLLQNEERQALWTALQEVPEVFRTVLVLADMQGLSYEEVAAIVGAPVGTVKSRLNRGREALRVVLTEKRSARPGPAGASQPGPGRGRP